MTYAASTAIQSYGPANSNLPRIFGYATADNLADVDAAGYFNAEVEKLQVGDFIFATCGNGSGIFVVNANDGTTVDTDNALTVGGTDSD